MLPDRAAPDDPEQGRGTRYGNSHVRRGYSVVRGPGTSRDVPHATRSQGIDNGATGVRVAPYSVVFQDGKTWSVMARSSDDARVMVAELCPGEVILRAHLESEWG